MTQSDDIFSKNVRLISKEAGLSATCLEQGLTALRKAHFTQKWHYYQAFFLLTIGIERLLKITIVTISRIEKNKLPNNGELKKYGHNIEQLFTAVSKLINPSEDFLTEDVLYQKIVSFLSEYATTSRYYNLDTLSGDEKTIDPLHKWKKIQDEIAKRHCKPLEFNEFEQTLLNAMRPYASVVHTNELDQPITSLDNLYLQGKSIDKVQGYSVYYIFKIICYLTDQLDKLSDRKYMMPVLSEFYPLFTHSSMTTRQVISRKNWNFLSTTR